MIPTPSTAPDAYVVVEGEKHLEGEYDEARAAEYTDSRPTKKMKMESNPVMGGMPATH